jgi:hypothetical protein
VEKLWNYRVGFWPITVSVGVLVLTLAFIFFGIKKIGAIAW